MADVHPDDIAVDKFAAELKEKMRVNRERGRSGWDQPGWMDACKHHMIAHLAKGDPRDIAIYAMFLWHHNETTKNVPLNEHAIYLLSQHLSVEYGIDIETTAKMVVDTFDSLGFFHVENSRLPKIAS